LSLATRKEPFGETVTYTNDKVGRLTQVAGAWSGGSQTYANNPHYRAWGALQNLDYGNGTEMNVLGFNSRLQATEFEVKKDTTSIISKDYEFHADGQMKLSTDNNNAKFDRLFKYDHQARMTNVSSGAEARGSTDTAANIPFGNTFGYNAFDNQTTATNKHFTNTSGGGFSHTYANNRISGLGNGYYDVDGRQIRSVDNGFKTYSYNAAGQVSSSYYEHRPNSTLVYENFETITYSGDGQVVKIATLHDPVEGDSESDTNYQIRSTVLGGQTITKVQAGGQKLESSIVAAGTVVATHGSDWINWRHNDPNSDSIRSTNSSGVSSGAGDDDFAAHELDAQGRSVGFTNPYSNDPQWDNIPDLFQAQQSYSSMINGMPTTYKVDGMSVPKQYFDDHSEFLVGNMFAMVRYSAWVSTRLVGYRKLSDPKKINRIEDMDVEYVDTQIPKGSTAYATFGDHTNYYAAVYANVASFQISSFTSNRYNNPPKWTVADLTDAAKKVIENAMKSPNGECAKLLGKDALEKFAKIVNNIEYNGKISAGRASESGRELPLEEAPGISARTIGDSIYLNPAGIAFKDHSKILLNDAGKRFLAGLESKFKDSGAADQREYAIAVIIHEFLHTTGKFKEDSFIDENGQPNSKKSEENQKEVLKKCFKKS